MDDLAQSLVEAIGELPVIDAHEHLPPEEEALSAPADLFTRIFCHYSLTNAESAGFRGVRDIVQDTSKPIEERWALFKPYLPLIRETGYVRAALIAVRELFGIEEITDDTLPLLLDRLNEHSRPGLYDEVLKKRCRIERILNQGRWRDPAGGTAVPVERDFLALQGATAERLRQIHARWSERHGGPFDSVREWVAFQVECLVSDGGRGLKFSADFPTECADAAAQDALYRKLVSGDLTDGESGALGAALMHCALVEAGRHRIPAAFHCGLQAGVWPDIRLTHPLNLVPVVRCYRETTFDLYHGGIPWMHEIVVMGNQYPNVHLNLCWCHQISPAMTERILTECLDLVPVNKVIGFGGDNVRGPEKTLGVLIMARENIARVLAGRIRRGLMTEERALEVARLWLYENPKRIYRL